MILTEFPKLSIQCILKHWSLNKTTFSMRIMNYLRNRSRYPQIDDRQPTGIPIGMLSGSNVDIFVNDHQDNVNASVEHF